ncbi:hypothetical protein [Paenibacillus ihumii]|nr:hypothetical protein [Paenibacillus ihumii]
MLGVNLAGPAELPRHMNAMRRIRFLFEKQVRRSILLKGGDSWNAKM